MKKKRVTGSVMVIGAGIQASLDLADSGFLVHLVEEKPQIGGVMAQLDKTFPTNDCAMCVISPKLVEAGRHLNIDLHTVARVTEVTGKAGNFKVTLGQEPRFVDLDKCTACGECAKVCPVDVKNLFDQGLSDRKAIYKLYPQGMPGAFAVDKQTTAPCKATCPAHVSIQGFIALMHQKKFKEALRLFKQEHPFSDACGRVCHHPCESICTRGDVDQPLAIQSLHRFLAQLDAEDPYIPEIKEKRDEKVSIVGSGPAGLTAASFDIPNVLCLSGDHQSFGDCAQGQNVHDLDSMQLVQTVRCMRDEGKFLGGDDISRPPKLFVGAAANPFADPFEIRVPRLAKKIAAGAEFIQTQCIYNLDKFECWIQQARDRGLTEKVYVLAGVTPMKSVGMAKYMRSKVPGMDLPDNIIARLAGVAKSEQAQEGIDICVEAIQRLKEVKGVAGFHIMAIEWEEKVPEIVERSGLFHRP